MSARPKKPVSTSADMVDYSTNKKNLVGPRRPDVGRIKTRMQMKHAVLKEKVRKFQQDVGIVAAKVKDNASEKARRMMSTVREHAAEVVTHTKNFQQHVQQSLQIAAQIHEHNQKLADGKTSLPKLSEVLQQLKSAHDELEGHVSETDKCYQIVMQHIDEAMATINSIEQFLVGSY